MSCWVAPVIAAEFLNTTVDDIMRRIADGTIPSRSEDGFLFVDVLPHVTGEPPARRPEPPPLTYVPADEDPAEEADVLFSWKDIRPQVAQNRRRPMAA